MPATVAEQPSGLATKYATETRVLNLRNLHYRLLQLGMGTADAVKEALLQPGAPGMGGASNKVLLALVLLRFWLVFYARLSGSGLREGWLWHPEPEQGVSDLDTSVLQCRIWELWQP